MASPRLLKLACGALALAGCKTEPEPAGPCVDDAAYFRTEVYPSVIEDVCMGCHTAEGAARSSGLVFVGPGNPDHEAHNRQVLTSIAGLERDGTSILLLKPLGKEGHGGGAVLRDDSASFAALQQFVERLDAPVSCASSAADSDGDAGLVLDTPVETLRKAALLLAGRLPTHDEVDSVRSGGDQALVTALWGLMDEPAFSTVFVEKLNDVLLTDRYLRNEEGLSILDEARFPGRYWFDGAEGKDKLRAATNTAIAREPLELAAYIMREDRPWTEILTADYTMVNGYSALSYGVTGAAFPNLRDPASSVFYEAKLPGFPHAGLLTTPAFLNRNPTTDTNRNRHRAWVFYKTFLATNILTFADRPIDPTVSDAHNPTLNDPQCTVCHATLDPVAGAFQAWDAEGKLAPREDGWYQEMAPPGFEGESPPSTARTAELSWLAVHSVEDPRFGLSAVRSMLTMFTGLGPLSASDVGGDEVKAAALEHQDTWIRDVAKELAARDWDIKYAVERVITSRYFRARAEHGASEGALLLAGTAHLLTPEELDRKIIAVTGTPWRPGAGYTDHLLSRYRLLYGGIDSFGITTRLTDPNGVIAAISRRMANEVACGTVARDFLLPPAQRRLFADVERSYVPETAEGFEVPAARDAIRANLRALHLRILGEDLGENDPELDATYALWVDAWKAGRASVQAEETSGQLDWRCMALYDPYSGDSLPEAQRITDDPDFTVRAWLTVTAYLLSDYRFLYE